MNGNRISIVFFNESKIETAYVTPSPSEVLSERARERKTLNFITNYYFNSSKMHIIFEYRTPVIAS